MQGGNFSDGFKSAMASSVFVQTAQDAGWMSSSASRTQNAAISAVIGGTSSVIGGGKFSNGAGSAAFVQLFGEAAANDDSYAVEEESLSVDNSDEPLMLASKGGNQNISVGGYNRHSDPADVKQAMDEAKSAGNQSHYRKLKGLLKVIKRGGRMFGPIVPTEMLNEIYPVVPVPIQYDLDTQQGWDDCFAAKWCS